MTVGVRLTDLSGSGGHGHKLPPAMLDQILARIPATASFPNLLVGTETADDAAVYRLNDQQAVVATLDFFAPVVDDPGDFGRIAATNALSDIYAMGGKPILALAIVGMPVETLPLETVQAILAGGASVCAAAGIPVAGGHSMAAQEPIYGLVALGLVNPNRILRNSTAQAGDRLILTKRLGTGIFTVALKRGELDAASYRDFLAATTQLNAVGAELPGIAGVHAVTDVTGFGLLGHALEMCRGAGLSLQVNMGRLPIFPTASRFAEAGVSTGAGKRNWESYGGAVDLPERLNDWRRGLLCDPQTSGGLLIACAPDAEAQLLGLLNLRGFHHACTVGTFSSGPPRLKIM
jgi:selenide, water dikinase